MQSHIFLKNLIFVLQEFDHQASRLVRQMFQAIEQLLFEGVLSGSTSLQQECREWMSRFPHLRIIGKQVGGKHKTQQIFCRNPHLHA